MFYKRAFLRNFTKFTGNHLCHSLFFNKVAGLRPEACSFIKNETLAQVFSYEFFKISKNTFTYRTPTVAASDMSLQMKTLLCHAKLLLEISQCNFLFVISYLCFSLKHFVTYKDLFTSTTFTGTNTDIIP